MSNYRGRTREKYSPRSSFDELKSICLSVRRYHSSPSKTPGGGGEYHDRGNGTRLFRSEDSGTSTTATAGGGTTGVIPRNEHIQLRFSLNSRKKSARPTRANFNVASLVAQRVRRSPLFSLPFLPFSPPLTFFFSSSSSLFPS